jgi:uncharacterized protein (TIGR00255 family)
VLLSMTGHGDASLREAPLNAAVEIRSVNHRHFKLNLRLPDGYGSWEPAVESLCRSHIARGSVHLTMSLQQEGSGTSSIDKELLARYFGQVQEALGETIPPLAELLPALLSLPGTVTQAATLADPDNHWPLAEECLQSALDNLVQMRSQEGEVMATDLSTNLQQMTGLLEQIAVRMPVVTEQYRDRLAQRIGQLLEPHNVQLNQSDLVREVAIFAERSDVSEEVVRSQSHISQFTDVMEEQASNGRALDFLAQEMFREANTIGSKANDSEIGMCVVELKTCIERIREMVQNVE